MKNTSIRNVRKNMKFITNYYKKLTTYTKQTKSVGSINEWIVDNYYLLSEQEQTINHELSSLKILQIKPKRKQYLDNLICSYLEQENFRLDTNLLFKFLNNYQLENDDFFTYDEIDYINSSIKCNIISKLRILSEKLKYKFLEKEKIDQCFKKISSQLEKDSEASIDNCLPIDKSLIGSHFKILEINHRLNSLGERSEEIFVKLNELLISNNTSLKEIINVEHDERSNENILMVNLISSFKVAIKFKLEDLYAKISYVEKALINEKAEVYDTMYEVSKIEYRSEIKKQVKKKKISEYEFAKNLLEKAGEEHVGFHLFKKKRYKARAYLYVTAVFLVALFVNYAIYIELGLLAFILFLLPMIGFSVEVITQILMKNVDTQTLFRIKLENHLPQKYSTMVVIPTILKDPDKVNQMFDNLELYYLSNRAQNLYFCLLGDVTSESTAKTKMDDKILNAGLERARKLNETYGKNIFHFAYRNRFFNPKEGSFLGYERKRGALHHFNQALLGKLSLSDQEKYFKGHTLAPLEGKIKYIITLDADTKLLLNTALKLIGTMVHPMNKPILSDDGRKVVKGHAIMQPRVSIDVEVTNISEYSQLFAGLGGLDIYSTKQFDLYQDVFGEGSFTGKGIYDLEIFDKVLGDTFPENLILSHDLLEGNYLRCGYISDVELFDGFPSKYLNDAMRHHRWTRGDWQIIGWLKKYVKDHKNDLALNPLNLISRWKIFDNLRRSLRSPLLFLIVLFGFALTDRPTLVMGIVFIIIAVPIFFYLLHQLLARQKYDILLRYYMRIIWGLMAVIAKSLLVFALLPYEAFLYMNAIVKACYRMLVSKKNLLNWVTSEEVEATAKNTLGNYFKNFKVNYVAAIAILYFAKDLSMEHVFLSYLVAFIWLIAPFLMYFVSRDIKNEQEQPGKRMESDVREIAQQTWAYFDKTLTKENNFLVPDNFQLNRNQKFDSRTSPTNIAFSLTAVISAFELKLISKNSAIDKINNIIKNVESLKKWNGHLYNWYDIKTKKELPPHFISTADSGNFISTLYVVKGFLSKCSGYNSLKYRIQKLIDKTDFSKLYNEEGDVFSIGYVVNEGTLVPYNYNNFLSEARLASFVAIAKGDVPFKHWFRLDKTLTKHKWYKGVVSWSGTMFEYYMPLIFMKTFEHTLLDETYAFAYYAQKEFVNEVSSKIPWGITESAYNELDDSQNYKYKAFGIPYLKFHDSEIPQIVISPYGSIMALTKYPVEVYNNIKKMKKIGMQGEFGLYEAYDHEDGAIVKAYYAHHQGMILTSITNYLKNNIIQEYFHADKNIQSVEILLKEKVQIRTYIDLKIARYKKYNYKRDVIDSDMREQEGIMPIPEVGVLSNGFYSTFINDRGIGFSKYKNLQINRYRKITDENHGLFVYIKNTKTNKIYPNTYSPSCTEPDHYHVVFASDRIKFVREDEDLITTTEITVAKDHNAEIRKIKVENTSQESVELELTSYGEVIMARPEEDIAHPVFNNVTIKAEIDEVTSSLMFSRRSRTKENTKYFVINRFFAEEDDGVFEYETSRMNFLGRNNTTLNPSKIVKNESLSSDCTQLLEPIMSIRKKITLKPNSKKTLYLLVGFGKSRQQVMEIVNAYNNDKKIEAAFDKATVLNNMRNRYAGLSGIETRAYNSLLKYVYQPTYEAGRSNLLRTNILTQQNLWKFGVSGDLPIIVVDVFSAENSGFIKDILRAYEFYKSRAIYIDIIIINNEIDEKKEIVNKYVERLLYRINNLNYFEDSPGSVKVVSDITEEERTLLKMVSSLYFDGSQRKPLTDQIYEMEATKTSISRLCFKKDMIPLGNKNSNEYGKFSEDGKEFTIKTMDTPMPWSNVIANEEFGSVITNNFGGFTYAHNSREFKLTSWSNDPVVDPPSESIFIDGLRLVPSEVVHGFGYSKFITKTENYDIETTVFVPTNDNVKIYDVLIKSKNRKRCLVEFDIKPVLGVSEETTNKYILSEFDPVHNCLFMRNTYSKIFKNEKVFVSSSKDISSCNLEDINSKSIMVNLDLENENRVSFMLGCGDFENVIPKYRDFENINNELNNVKKYWDSKVGNITIETPDKDLNNMVNGWILYQAYASRLYSRAALYQVGGATGFRDQLQDSLCLLYNNPEYARKQILEHANHQFAEGDVLHWWHEDLRFGARTRFSDDYLWLVYCTYEYVKATNDYSILEEKVGFVEADQLQESESEKGVDFTYSASKETLYYHLKLAINKAVSQFGKNKLPLMGSGDWNDGMSKVGHLGKGESVWVGFFLHENLERMSEMTEDAEFKEMCMAKSRELKESINENAWDGAWYTRAFFDDGTPMGTSENKECQIDLISQAWSIITDVAPKDRRKSVISAVENQLVDKEVGLIKLLDPAFTGLENNPGYISDYLPGVRENGGQYTHGALWYIMALAKLRDPRAYEHFKMIMPSGKDSDVYKVEPYVIAADIYSNPAFNGHGGWTWYTGSASWAYKVALEGILGFKKVGNTLVIKPNFPKKWGSIKISYEYFETTYNLEINYKDEESIIELENDKKIHDIVLK